MIDFDIPVFNYSVFLIDLFWIPAYNVLLCLHWHLFGPQVERKQNQLKLFLGKTLLLALLCMILVLIASNYWSNWHIPGEIMSQQIFPHPLNEGIIKCSLYRFHRIKKTNEHCALYSAPQLILQCQLRENETASSVNQIFQSLGHVAKEDCNMWGNCWYDTVKINQTFEQQNRPWWIVTTCS